MNIPEGCKSPDDCIALFACAARFLGEDGKRWEFEQLLASPLSDDGTCKLTAVYFDFLEDSKPFDRAVRAAVQVIDENRGIQDFLSHGLNQSVGPRVREIRDEAIPARPPPISSPTSRELTAPARRPHPEAVPMNDDKKSPTALNIENVTGDVIVSQGQTGGITAHTVNNVSDRRLIASIVLRVSIEVETAPASPSEVETSAGLSSALALFTKGKQRIRFVTDFMSHQQQLSPTKRRLSLEYQPETKDEVLGKPLDSLQDVEVLAVNYASFFRDLRFDVARAGTFSCDVVINGVVVGALRVAVPPGALAEGQREMAVGTAFSTIPVKYAAAVSTR